MNGHWTIATGVTWCGHGAGHAVPVGDPVYRMVGKIVRCVDHAPAHVVLDDAAVDAARLAYEAHEAETRAAGQSAAEVPATAATCGPDAAPIDAYADTSTSDRAELHTQRSPPPRAPLPFADVAHVPDPKAQAFND